MLKDRVTQLPRSYSHSLLEHNLLISEDEWDFTRQLHIKLWCFKISCFVCDF